MAAEDLSGSDTTPPSSGGIMVCPRDDIIAGLVGGGLDEMSSDTSVMSSMFANSGAEDSLSAPSLSLFFSMVLRCRAVGSVHAHRMNKAMMKTMRRAPREMARMSFFLKPNPAK